MRALVFTCLLSAIPTAHAQTVVRADEHLDADRPEAWAMNYFAASTLMTAGGQTPALAPGRWQVAVDLGHVPRLSAEQRQVGFNGFKSEDLNRSPVFGRLHGWIGLPGGWVGEIGYTPPVEVEDTEARDLVALGIGRRVLERGAYTLSVRLFGQHGRVHGDITCPERLAGVEDGERNPYGCQAASRDRVTLNYYGLDLTSTWAAADWRWHATVGAVRAETEVQVDALTYDQHDLSLLQADSVLPLFVVGAQRDLSARWSVGAELLYVPLEVRRQEGAGREHDPLTSLRLQLRYRP